jgi:hypothetical protein
MMAGSLGDRVTVWVYSPLGLFSKTDVVKTLPTKYVYFDLGGFDVGEDGQRRIAPGQPSLYLETLPKSDPLHGTFRFDMPFIDIDEPVGHLLSNGLSEVFLVYRPGEIEVEVTCVINEAGGDVDLRHLSIAGSKDPLGFTVQHMLWKAGYFFAAHEIYIYQDLGRAGEAYHMCKETFVPAQVTDTLGVLLQRARGGVCTEKGIHKLTLVMFERG